jgi:calcineurin-like phosphoesterase family protein
MLLAFKDAFRQRETEKIVMHHIDGNCLNCALSNLTVETYSSISYYRTDTSGFQYDHVKNAYAASITLNGELIQLGHYPTAEEAHDKYIKTRALLQERSREAQSS